jgi:hippurate hydrolase
VPGAELLLTGVGSHGPMPERSVDPVVAGAALVMGLQSIVSRNVAPMDAAVPGVGAFLAGDAGNVIPPTATLRLSVRTRRPATRVIVLDKIRRIVKATAEAYNVAADIREGSPGAVLVNDAEQTARCIGIARALLGEAQVVSPGPTCMGSEDVAFHAQRRPAVYAFPGNGDTPMVHPPMYAFDEANLGVGAAYWVALAPGCLGGPAA